MASEIRTICVQIADVILFENPYVVDCFSTLKCYLQIEQILQNRLIFVSEQIYKCNSNHAYSFSDE